MPEIEWICPDCGNVLSAAARYAGESIICPRCMKAASIPGDRAVNLGAAESSIAQAQPNSDTRDCPFCGEPILARAIKCKHCGEFLNGASKAATSPITGYVLSAERELWSDSPSLLEYGPALVLGVVTLPIFGLGIFILVWVFWSRSSSRYLVTTRRVVSEVGILSRSRQEVGIGDIRSIGLKQGLAGRMFGVGDVEVASAGTAGVEVVFKGIAGVEGVRRTISEAKDAHMQAR